MSCTRGRHESYPDVYHCCHRVRGRGQYDYHHQQETPQQSSGQGVPPHHIIRTGCTPTLHQYRMYPHITSSVQDVPHSKSSVQDEPHITLSVLDVPKLWDMPCSPVTSPHSSKQITRLAIIPPPPFPLPPPTSHIAPSLHPPFPPQAAAGGTSCQAAHSAVAARAWPGTCVCPGTCPARPAAAASHAAGCAPGCPATAEWPSQQSKVGGGAGAGFELA